MSHKLVKCLPFNEVDFLRFPYANCNELNRTLFDVEAKIFSFDVIGGSKHKQIDNRAFPVITSGRLLLIIDQNINTHFFVLFYPLAYPYQDDNSVAAATADGGNPYSSPLLELYFFACLKKLSSFCLVYERSG